MALSKICTSLSSELFLFCYKSDLFSHPDLVIMHSSLFLLSLQPRNSDKKSELLPADWSSNKELYSLRYKAKDGDTQLLLKAIAVDSTLIFNLMVGTAGKRTGTGPSVNSTSL